MLGLAAAKSTAFGAAQKQKRKWWAVQGCVGRVGGPCESALMSRSFLAIVCAKFDPTYMGAVRKALAETHEGSGPRRAQAAGAA